MSYLMLPNHSPVRPNPGDHLVGAEQDPVPVADLAHALEVAGRRHERAARVLHRLEDHHRDGLRPCLLDRLGQVGEKKLGELLLRLRGRPVVAVRVANVDHVRDERLERRAQRGDPVDRERAHRRAVVRGAARDRLPPALAVRHVVLARELPRGLDGLRAAGDEERAVDVLGRELGQALRELDRARVRIRPVRVERQLAHLSERRLADLLAVGVTDVDGEEAGERVEVPLAVVVPQVAVLAAHDDRRLVAVHTREVQPEMVARRGAEVGHGHRPSIRRFPDCGLAQLLTPWSSTRCGRTRAITRSTGVWKSLPS